MRHEERKRMYDAQREHMAKTTELTLSCVNNACGFQNSSNVCLIALSKCSV